MGGRAAAATLLSKHDLFVCIRRGHGAGSRGEEEEEEGGEEENG